MAVLSLLLHEYTAEHTKQLAKSDYKISWIHVHDKK